MNNNEHTSKPVETKYQPTEKELLWLNGDIQTWELEESIDHTPTQDIENKSQRINILTYVGGVIYHNSYLLFFTSLIVSATFIGASKWSTTNNQINQDSEVVKTTTPALKASTSTNYIVSDSLYHSQSLKAANSCLEIINDGESYFDPELYGKRVAGICNSMVSQLNHQ